MKTVVKNGSKVKLWGGSEGIVSDINRSTYRFRISSIGWFHIMDINYLDGEYIKEAGTLVFEDVESLNEKYFRLIGESNKEDSYLDFIFQHSGSYYRVVWDGLKWSNPMCIKLLL